MLMLHPISRLLVCTLVCLFSFTSLSAQKLESANPVGKPVKKGPLARINPDLLYLQEEYQNFSVQRNARAVFQPSNGLVQTSNGMVAIEVAAEASTETLIPELERLGMKNISVYGRLVSGMLPIDSLQKLAGVRALRLARPAYKPYTNIGRVTSQGDKAQRSDLVKNNLGIIGRGVTVGVLSDSYDFLNGAAAGIASGDLPGAGNPNGFTTPVNVLAEAGDSDEGRAMLEIVHDVAPGANLAFHTALGGQPVFANGILRLQEAGCEVIVDDITYFAEPFFQDGIVAQAVDEVVKRGATYFSSAGNLGRLSYQNAFAASGINLTDGSESFGMAHDFGNGNILQRVRISPGTHSFVLQWDDPFFSVSGGEGARTDLDFYLVFNNQILFGSETANIGGDPLEIFSVTYNPPDNSTIDISLLITKRSGPDPSLIKYVVFDDGPVQILDANTNSSTLFGHANARGAIAVAAARFDRTPAFGVNPPRVESFSSAGGTPVLFDTRGRRRKEAIRRKPEITAPNGTSNTFFGGFDYNGDGFPNFFGTSASAPHVAAVAALMLEASQRQVKAGKILDALQQTAVDMDDPFTPGFDQGFDFATGFGLIQADKAVKEVIKAPGLVARLTLTSMCSDNPAVERRWRIRNPNAFPVGVSWQLHGTRTLGYTLAPPGDSFFFTPAMAGPNTTIISWHTDKGERQQTVKASGGAACTAGAVARLGFEDAEEEVLLVGASPNPATDKLTLVFTDGASREVTLRLLDTKGQVVLEVNEQIGQGRVIREMDVSRLSSGLYLLQVHSAASSHTIKVVKQ